MGDEFVMAAWNLNGGSSGLKWNSIQDFFLKNNIALMCLQEVRLKAADYDFVKCQDVEGSQPDLEEHRRNGLPNREDIMKGE